MDTSAKSLANKSQTNEFKIEKQFLKHCWNKRESGGHSGSDDAWKPVT